MDWNNTGRALRVMDVIYGLLGHMGGVFAQTHQTAHLTGIVVPHTTTFIFDEHYLVWFIY